MLFIKIKVNGYLKNITENTKETIDLTAIKKSNTISYIKDNTKHQIIIDKTKITLIRDNQEFSQGIIFDPNKTTNSEYYLKQQAGTFNFTIKTTSLTISDTKIEITYQVLESENNYKYVLEMSDIK